MTVLKEAIKIREKIPIMTYSQYRRARKLVHQCCNYDGGNCLALDDGVHGAPQSQMTLWGEDEQRSKRALLFIGKRVIWSLRGRVCVQSISCSLLCRWFRVAVLPLDESLETALLHQKEQKRCAVCGQPFLPGSNRAKYCKSCAAIVHRRQKTLSDRKKRAACGQLEAKKP